MFPHNSLSCRTLPNLQPVYTERLDFPLRHGMDVGSKELGGHLSDALLCNKENLLTRQVTLHEDRLSASRSSENDTVSQECGGIMRHKLWQSYRDSDPTATSPASFNQSQQNLSYHVQGRVPLSFWRVGKGVGVLSMAIILGVGDY